MRWAGSEFLFALLCPVVLAAQPPVDEGPDLEETIEDIVSESEAEFEYDTYLDHLNAFIESPLNLNTATQDQLHHLGLLSGEQIQALMQYIRYDGELITLYELQAVPFFDIGMIARILPYVAVTTKSRPSLRLRDFHSGRHESFMRYQQVLEKARGYTADSTRPRAYPGSPARLYLRYRYTKGRRLQYGFTTEKDPGEELLRGTQRTVDYFSAHLFVRDQGVIRALAIGDYEVSIGQGLAMWSGFGLSKGAEPLRLRRGGYALRPYTSVNESRFLRGAAASLAKGRWELTVFGSSNRRDANIAVYDTLREDVRVISSLQETGLHRTASELDDKHAIRAVTAGAAVKYSSRRSDIGLYGIHNQLSASFERTPRPYNQFQFSGNRLTNLGGHYTIVRNNVMLFGETALSDNGGIATLNALQIALDHRTALLLVHRYYDKTYQSLFGNAFGEASGTNNEQGVYVGVRINLSSVITFEGFADFYKHPWLRFTADAPSQGQEYMARLSYRPSYHTELYVRGRYETKLANEPGNTEVIDPVVQTEKLQLRVHLTQSVNRSIALKSRAEWVKYRYDSVRPSADDDEPSSTAEQGFMIYQDVIWSVPKTKLKLYGRFAMFDTDSYTTRIYAYENDVLYAFSIPAYYDKGTRAYVLMRYKVAKWMNVWLRVAKTYYSNITSIGSGPDAIMGNRKTEVKAQVKLSF